jgi:hypothetical protein
LASAADDILDYYETESITPLGKITPAGVDPCWSCGFGDACVQGSPPPLARGQYGLYNYPYHSRLPAAEGFRIVPEIVPPPVEQQQDVMGEADRLGALIAAELIKRDAGRESTLEAALPGASSMPPLPRLDALTGRSAALGWVTDEQRQQHLLRLISAGIDFAMPVDSDDELFARAVETIEVALETAKALVRQAGAARVDDVVNRAASDSSLMLRREQLVDILSAVPGFAWLEKKRGWFWLSEVGKNVAVTRVTKILSVAPRIEVERLHEGIRRDYRTEDFVMPENVLLALCAQLAMCTVEGQTVVATEAIDPAAVLEGAEMELVRLLQTHGPIVDRGELKELADGAGIGEPSFYSRTRYSPVIEEFSDGRLGLRGA